MNSQQRQIKKALNSSANIFADKIVYHKNGSVSVKRSYFYRHGNTAELWAGSVSLEMERLLPHLDFDVDSRDDYNNWPKDSYFVAVIEPRG